MPASEVVLTEERGNVLVVTLNRPAARNAVDRALADGLCEALARLDDEPGLSVGVLTGAGGTFCAGMDLKAFLRDGPPTSLVELTKVGTVKPLVAAVEGYAMGGGLELVLLCDLVVAARGARLGVPEARVGLFAAGGGLLRLPHRLPYCVAAELALTGEPITAEAAHAHGLVNRLADDGDALAVALEVAEAVARNAPLSLAAGKHLLRQSVAGPEDRFWEVQAAWMDRVFASEDAKEGPLAFAEKRPPSWRGR